MGHGALPAVPRHALTVNLTETARAAAVTAARPSRANVTFMSLRSLQPFVSRVLPNVAGMFTSERRLVICLALTLIAIQVGLMVFLKSKHDELTAAAIRDVLQGGYQTVQNQVFEEQEKLTAETKMMASEFGLRQAVATRDQPTIDSMLENHQARSSRIQYAVRPWVGDPATADKAAQPFPDLMDFTVLRDDGGSRLVTYRHADILAPRPIASLRGTLAIDDTFARRLSKLTGFELIVSGSTPGGPHRVLATSLTPAATTSAFHQLGTHQTRTALDLAAQPPQASADKAVVPPAEPMPVVSADAYSFVRVKALGSPVEGDVWLWIGKLDKQAVPALLDAASVVQGWILGSLILSVFTVSLLSYKLVRPISASANTDVLTGLPNRRAFVPAANAAMASCWSEGQSVAVLSMDLDKFKPINDALGHAAGDEVLRVVGARLRSFFRSGDLVARIGGDEFCALIKNVDESRLQALADRAREALQAPIKREGKDLVIGCSIGVMMARREDALGLEDLMGRADTALYTAKRTRSGTVFWRAEIGAMKADGQGSGR